MTLGTSILSGIADIAIETVIEVVDWPILHRDFPSLFVCLPEGKSHYNPIQYHETSWNPLKSHSCPLYPFKSHSCPLNPNMLWLETSGNFGIRKGGRLLFARGARGQTRVRRPGHGMVPDGIVTWNQLTLGYWHMELCMYIFRYNNMISIYIYIYIYVIKNIYIMFES